MDRGVLFYFILCGDRIAYCSGNSITLEGPYHLLRNGSSMHKASWYWDHHKLTVGAVLRSKGLGSSERQTVREVIELFVVCWCYSPHWLGCSKAEQLLCAQGKCSFSLLLFASSVNSFL